MSQGRGNFNSRFAAIMAMAGSAVGLGNIWRFPYMVGEHGGAAFIIIYIACCLLVSLPIFFSESIIGKSTRKDTFGAMESLAPKSRNVGYVAILASFIILSFYSVVGGWSFDYLIRSCAGSFSGLGPDEAKAVFASMGSSPVESVSCMLVFLGLSAMIVGAGVDKGIGRFSKISIPVLFLMVVLIAVESLRLPGAEKGVEYLMKPDFSKIDGPAIAAALGQSFFSLSLGVGTILTYSSYMREDEDILQAGGWTAFFDTVFALIAGFAIMPAVFACGVEPGAGPGLVFQTLPFIFNKMGTSLPILSSLVSIIFFVTILVAALTSAISMMEVGVSYLVDNKGMSRSWATIIVTFFAWAVGILCSLSFGPLSEFKIVGNTIFDFLDKMCSNFLMAFGGLLFTLFVGWKMDKAAVEDEFTNSGTKKNNNFWFKPVYFLIKYVAPVAIVLIFVTNLIL